MPQGRKKSAVDIFEQEQRKPSAVDIFEQGQATPPTPAAPPTGPAPGFFEREYQNLKIGAQRTLLSAADAGRVMEEALGAATKGDFGPLKQIGELVGRGAINIGSAAAAGPYGAGQAYVQSQIEQAPRVAQIRQEQAERMAKIPELYSREAEAERARLDALAARDPSLLGKVTRGASEAVTSAIPAVITGAATGGSVPAVAGMVGLQSMAQPENLPLNVALASVPLPLGKAVAPILRRIRGARRVESVAGDAVGAFEGSAPQPSPSLAKAIGENAFDDTKVAVKDLGLEHVPQPNRPADAFPVRREIPVDDITLSRDNLSRGRMFQAQEALEGGVKGEGETFTTPGGNQRAVEPIQVVPDPNAPGKFIVQGDGNHRVALLKLQGNTDLIPVKSFETEAQSAVVNEATAGLRENYYNPPMKMPELGEGGFEQPELTASFGTPKRYAGASGPRISQYGIVEGSPLEQAIQRGGKVSDTLGPDAESQLAAESGTLGTPEQRDSIFKTIGRLFQAGLLTAPTTHMKILGHMGGLQISEELARIPGSIADMVASAFTGQRTFTGANLMSMGRSAYRAATEGVSEAGQILKQGATDTQIAAGNLPKELNSGSKIIDTYVNTVFRVHGAEDQLVRTYALQRSLEDRAKSLAVTEARQGVINRGQVGDRTRELIANPPEDLAAGAVLDSAVATYNNPSMAAAIRTGISRGLERFGQAGKAADLGIDAVIPFVKKPANVISRLFDYAGIGLGKASFAAAKGIINRSMSPAEQRAFSTSFGRGVTGPALITLGYIGWRDGWLTGLREDDPVRQARDQAAGRIPGAVRVGDGWHQIAGIGGPIADLMVIGATLGRDTERERELQRKQQPGQQPSPLQEAGAFGGALAKVTGQVAMEHPMAAGTKRLVEGIEQPGSAGERFLGNLAAGAVPTGVSNIAQTIDQTPRQAQGFLPQIENRLPFVRSTLPVATDALGRPLQDFGFGAIDPTKTTLSREDQVPILKELVRLDMGLSRMNKKPDEADDAYRARVQRFGSLYQQFAPDLLSDPLYRRATDEDKKKALDSLSSRAKAQVADELANGIDRAAPPKYRLDPRDIMQSILLREREKQFNQQRQPPR